MARAVVFEGAYEVTARFAAQDDNGEVVPKFDRLVYAESVAARLRACGRACEIVQDDAGVLVSVPIGDAPDEEFDTVAGLMIEALS